MDKLKSGDIFEIADVVRMFFNINSHKKCPPLAHNIAGS